MTDISPYMILDLAHIWPILGIIGIVSAIMYVIWICFPECIHIDDIDGGDDK